MILDSLANAMAYAHVHPDFKLVFDYIRDTDFSQVAYGKIPLRGDDVFLIYSETQGKTADEARLEAHQRYIDIQIPLSHTEVMGWAPVSELHHPHGSYQEEKDIIFYEDEQQVYITVKPDHFVVFFPQDGHQPCIAEGNLIKLIAKIRV